MRRREAPESPVFRKGDRVRVSYVVRGKRGGVSGVHNVSHAGKVVHVGRNYVVVNNGLYNESFWTDSDRTNKEYVEVLS